ncbi:DUF1659 domain-containing protein [Clostridium sp. MSJ-8]|uniref:DUF1659 domain-containing protein n=1 Tax=Clostridium sp. MSJ-8 TaxID=2841510 RepID=UPI001C0ECB0E|nr:DUF1659 domain-containing protein [Clostridium sp. MSJ-8]MBU5488347.1 DUF1659 domain-containing protein [Clostridium sp. MSJ-8]
MANRTLDTKKVSLINKSTNSEGKTVTTSQSFSNIRPTATDDSILAVANAISSILSKTTDIITISETNQLSE